MGIIFAVAKLLIATILKLEYRNVAKYLRYYLILCMCILSILTSIGIYGFLSHSYMQTKSLDNTVQAKVNLIKKKNELYVNNSTNLKQQLETVNQSISDLRKSLSTDQQTQQVVKGQIITNIISSSKKGVQDQLDKALLDKDRMELQFNKINDSIAFYDLKVIEIENSSEVASELGPLKYISTVTGITMDQVVNYLMLLIIFIFDPLALCLVWVYFSIQTEPTIEKDDVVIEPEIIETVIPTIKKPRNVRKKLGRPTKSDKINAMIDEVIPPPIIEQKIEQPKPPVKRTSKLINSDLPKSAAKQMQDAVKKKL
jgi:hypothetical protein